MDRLGGVCGIRGGPPYSTRWAPAGFSISTRCRVPAAGPRPCSRTAGIVVAAGVGRCRGRHPGPNGRPDRDQHGGLQVGRLVDRRVGRRVDRASSAVSHSPEAGSCGQLHPGPMLMVRCLGGRCELTVSNGHGAPPGLETSYRWGSWWWCRCGVLGRTVKPFRYAVADALSV